jgi:hypothetical protein
MKTLIIQSSHPRTASTVLVNALYGLIPKLFSREVIFYNHFAPIELYPDLDINVVKTHNFDIDGMIKQYGDRYRLYFVCSERKELYRLFHDKYRSYNNVAIFDYDELNETDKYALEDIVNNIYEVLKHLHVGITLDKSLCYRRLIAMNRRYEQIQDKGFGYVDPFFNIHGSHRSRGSFRKKYSLRKGN